jgi:hypothetical protein
MSGTTKEWVSRELKRLAEDEQHGFDDFVYDSITQRHGGVYAQENIDRKIPNKTLPPVRWETARIIRVLEDILESDDNAVLQEGADRLENIILSYSAEKRLGIYLNVVEIILDAAKFVDEQGASMKVAQLVSALAFRDDLINSTGAELTYEIGDFWKRPVTIQPDAPLTGEGGDRIWSQMPSLQLWIREALDSEYDNSLRAVPTLTLQQLILESIPRSLTEKYGKAIRGRISPVSAGFLAICIFGVNRLFQVSTLSQSFAFCSLAWKKSTAPMLGGNKQRSI